MKQIRASKALLCGLLLAHTTWSPAFASASQDDMIENSKLCLKHFAREERENGIPKHLLFAVSSTESGRWHKAAGVALPWPWTVNAEGKGYYFDNKSDAIAAVTRFRAQGIRSIDVGCMQINLMHHPEAFTSVSQAFDPETNIAYGAKFLRNNYSQLQSWKRAVAAYHSRTAGLGDGYFGLVKKNWLRALELVGGGTSYAKSAYQRVAEKQPQTASYEQPQEQPQAATAEQQQPTNPMAGYKSPSMKVISISEAAQNEARNADVMVIRPNQESARNNKPVRLALAGANNIDDVSTRFVTGSDRAAVTYPSDSTLNRDDVRAGQPRSIALDTGARPSAKRGPNFIFP